MLRDQASFQQAVLFAFSDVRREIALAKASATPTGPRVLTTLGIQTGGGNFLAALGLLCFTEYGGKLKFDNKKPNGSDHAAKNFNDFFDGIGTDYAAFHAAGNNVYNVFRCGLAHEYFVKQPCVIMIESPAGGLGVGRLGDGRFYFAVEKYCDDLQAAFAALESFMVSAGKFTAASHGGPTTSGYTVT